MMCVFQTRYCLADSILRYQYTDDMTINKHCVVKGLLKGVVKLISTLDSLDKWSFRSNPALKKKKK